eukprot:8997609-Pyramimonas_sp.AAC.1
MGFIVGIEANRMPFRPIVRSPSVNVPLLVLQHVRSLGAYKENAIFCSGTKRGGGFLRFVMATVYSSGLSSKKEGRALDVKVRPTMSRPRNE